VRDLPPCFQSDSPPSQFDSLVRPFKPSSLDPVAGNLSPPSVSGNRRYCNISPASKHFRSVFTWPSPSLSSPSGSHFSALPPPSTYVLQVSRELFSVTLHEKGLIWFSPSPISQIIRAAFPNQPFLFSFPVPPSPPDIIPFRYGLNVPYETRFFFH